MDMTSNKRQRENVTPYLFILPGMVVLIAVILFPFAQNVFYSFTKYSLINNDMSIIGLGNYKETLLSEEFRNDLMITFIWTFLNIAMLFLFGVVTAFLINSNLKGVVFLQFFLLVPWILPEIVTGYTWQLLLTSHSGIYTQILEFLRIIPKDFDIFANSYTAMIAVVMANVWRSFPLVALTTFAKLKTLPAEQVEAGIIDGANRAHIFRYIEWPHISATVKSTMLLCFIWTFNAFGIIYVMTGGGPVKATETLPIILQRKAFNLFDFSGSATMSVLMILILLIVIGIINYLPKLKEKLPQADL
jgi:multiple sugar transport system permease protein